MKHIRIVAALMLIALLPPGAARAEDAVWFRLNRYLGGLHAPFYYGKAKGFYRDEGIELTISEGRSSPETVQSVAAGTDLFGLADSSSLIGAAAKGADVKSVMSLLNASPFAVISLAASGIKSPKDLEGRSLAATPGDPMTLLFRAFAAANQLDTSRIRIVPVDPAAKATAVAEKRADALLGSVDDQYFLIKSQGKGFEPAALRYADNGANTVGLTVVTKGATIAGNPQLVRRFVKATVRAWEEARKEPEAAIDALRKVKPDLEEQSALDQLTADFALIDSANSLGKIGWGVEEDWSDTIDLVKKYLNVQTGKDWTAFHTNDFLPE